MRALGSFLSPRMRVPRDALVATGYEMLVGGLALTVIGSIAYSPSELDPSSWSGRSVFGLVYLIVFGSLLGYSAYAWLLANAPIEQGVDLRLRQPGRRDRPRRDRPRRVA